MTNFFEYQKQARKKSNQVLLVFGLMLLGLLFIYNYFIYWGLSFQNGGIDMPSSNPIPWTHQGESQDFQFLLLFIFIFGFIAAYIYWIIQYKSNPKGLVLSMGGIPISFINQNITPHEKRLLNVVEEMCIAAGIPIVPVFVLKDEPSINAFTAGHDLQTAYIVVTQGALDRLNRDEMQAVVAHEVGHIVSADVSMNAVLLSCIAALTFLMTAGYKFLEVMGRGRRSSSSKNNGAGGVVALALLLIVIGYVGAVAGKILQSLFSRQREFLADSLGVQFTRNPSALASALTKIKFNFSGEIKKAEAINIAHMCIANPVRHKFFTSLFASHPSIDKRIEVLDPNFLNEEYVADFLVTEKKNETIFKDAPPKINITKKDILNGVLVGAPVLSIEEVNEQKKALEAIHLDQDLHDEKNFKYSVWALFVSSDRVLREKQISGIKNFYKDFNTHKMTNTILEVSKKQKLGNSILSLAMVQIKNMSEDKRHPFFESLKLIMRLDQKFCAYERIALASLMVASQEKVSEIRINSQWIKRVIALFVELGTYPDDIRKNVYRETLEHYYHRKIDIEPLDYISGVSFEELVLFMHKLNGSSVDLKQQVCRAFLFAITYDSHMSTQETEAYRAFCMAIGIPSPPITNTL